MQMQEEALVMERRRSETLKVDKMRIEHCLEQVQSLTPKNPLKIGMQAEACIQKVSSYELIACKSFSTCVKV